jgi:phosphoserine phosphatase
MSRYTIIWDFDGTILPLMPYDSEQTLLIHKLNQPQNGLSLFKRVAARALIYADMKECFRKTFKKVYVSLMQGSHRNDLNQVAERLAKYVSQADRRAIQQLSADGHDMMVLSCGTIDLGERVLKAAALENCFSRIEGNRFIITEDRLNGMDYRVPNPEDKVKRAKTWGIHAAKTIAIGDGYTDLPLLDWAAYAVMIDRIGKKKNRYNHRGYHFISSIPELIELI